MAIAQTSPPTVAFIGLGAMGFAMSTHLLKQGVCVSGYDVYQPTLERFQATVKSIPDAKASIASSPAEAAKSASIVLLMVATHHHVNAALFDSEVGAIKTMPKDAAIIICSTVPPTHPPEVRQRLDTEFSRPDVKLIDAPVSGGVVGSASGTLTIMASSNDPTAISNPTVKHVLSNLSQHGKKLFVIPGSLGSGTSAKALNQVMCGTHIVGGSEIMALAALSGLNTRSFYDTMRSPDPTNGQRHGWTWMFENRGPRMLDLTLPISSAISIITKDVGIIKDEETRLAVVLPQLNEVHASLARCVDAGLAAVDDALINQWYLGHDSARKDLAARQAQPDFVSSLSANDCDAKTSVLLQAHALVNFMSAYETVLFAEALELMGDEQRRMWFAIIGGAAGASTVFSEVIPKAFASMPEWQAGFREYAKDVLAKMDLQAVEVLIGDAKRQGVEPLLVETALAFVKTQIL